MKKILTALIVIVAMALSYGLFIKHSGVMVSADINAEKDFIAQVFYSDGVVLMDEAHSVKQNVIAGESHINIEIPMQKVSKFRFDFGVHPGRVMVKDLALIGKDTIKLDTNKFKHFNETAEPNESGNEIVVMSEGNDPFMTYTEAFDVTEKTSVNWLMFLILLCVYGSVSYKVVNYLFRNK